MSRQHKRNHKTASRVPGAPTPEHNAARSKGVAQSRSSRGPSPLLLSMCGIVIVSLMIFFGFQFFSHPDIAVPPGGTAGDTASSTAVESNGKGANVTPPAQKASSPWNNQDFVTTVMNSTADSLHLSLDQLSQKVQAGMQISDVATQQNLSADQLNAIELTALQTGLHKLVSTGQETQEDADSTMEHWRQRDRQNLNRDFTYQLGGMPPIPTNITATVVAK